MTLLILLIGSSWGAGGTSEHRHLYADDMGYGDLHIQNPESRIPTPNLDRLAGKGHALLMLTVRLASVRRVDMHCCKGDIIGESFTAS